MMEAGLVRKALNIIEENGMFKLSYLEWRESGTNDKTLIYFYKHFRTDNKEYRRDVKT